jgi:hypothetical protein
MVRREWGKFAGLGSRGFAAKDVAMARAGSQLVWGVLFLVLLVGCRTPQPVLKPAPQPEVLAAPPKEARFTNGQYPDVAFRDMNSQFRKPLDGSGNGILPARGSSAAPGMMPGGGMSPTGMGGAYR